MRKVWGSYGLTAILVLLVLTGLVIVWQARRTAEQETYRARLTFFSVGKADCILVEQQGLYMLIDAGEEADAPAIARALSRAGVKKLEAVVATHPDKDHIGGMAEIFSRFDVGAFYLSGRAVGSGEYRAMMEAAKARGLTPVVPQAGDSFALGEMTCSVVWPKAYDYEGENNNSIVLRLEVGSATALLCADAQKEAEADMLSSGSKVAAQLIKIGHHGGNKASTAEFLDAVGASVAIISSGEGKDAPSEKVRERLLERGMKIFETAVMGDIVFAVNEMDEWVLLRNE